MVGANSQSYPDMPLLANARSTGGYATIDAMRWRHLIVGIILFLAIVAIRTGPTGRFFVYTPLFLFGPGYLLERWLRLPIPQPARPGIWLGLSLSIIPLLYLWATTFGLAITPFRLFVLVLMMMVALVWAALRDLGGANPQLLLHKASLEPALWAMLFAVVLALTAWTRLRHIDGLAFPPWVDSVHHALLIRVASEQGMAPISLQPYLPIDQLAYHWGYHVIAAALLQSTGLSLPVLMLWFGQVLSTLSVLAIACCALALWQQPLAAVVAGMIPGLISIMPAYYLSWGRYTLLMGMLILPMLLIATRELLRAPTWRTVAISGLLLAGLNLVHFVAFIFALIWYPIVWLSFSTPQSRWKTLSPLIAAGIIAFALTAPWILLLLGRFQPGVGQSPLNIQGSATYNAMPEHLLWARNNRLLLALAAAGGLLGHWRRWRAAPAIVLWSLLVLLLANPGWIGLPYLSFVTNLVVAISLFLPISLLIGCGAAALHISSVRRLSQRADLRWRALVVAVILLLAFWKAQNFQSVIRSDTILATQSDLQAIEWIASHTPPEARFVVNTEGWLYDVMRGADGGWWVLPLAGRQVSTPPVIFTYGPPTYTENVKQQTAWLREDRDRTPEELADFMWIHGYTHVYATAQGRLLNASQLAATPYFERIYGNEQVSIFKLTGSLP